MLFTAQSNSTMEMKPGFKLNPNVGREGTQRQKFYTEVRGKKEHLFAFVTTRADKKVMTCAIVYPFKRTLPSARLIRFCQVFCRKAWQWMNDIQQSFEYFANVFLPQLAAVRQKNKGLKGDDKLKLTDDNWWCTKLMVTAAISPCTCAVMWLKQLCCIVLL